MKKYTLEFTEPFNDSYERLFKNNKRLSKRIQKALKLLANDPFYPSLKSHRAQTRLYGDRYSSWVTGDIRIIWDFDEDNRMILILLDVGGHSGKKKVYGS